MGFDEEIEREMKKKGLTAPKVTADMIEAKVQSEMYYRFPGTNTTVCLLIMENGYSVVGESAPAHNGNFNAEIGRKVARQHARDKLWSLEGYLLKEQIHTGEI